MKTTDQRLVDRQQRETSGEENSRDQMIVTLLFEHEMHVGGSHGMPPQLHQKLTDGSVVGDGVGDGDDGVEPKRALGVTGHDAAAVGAVPVGVLDVVVARGIRLPDVDLDALDGLAVDVLDGAQDQQGLAVLVVRHQLAVAHVFGLVGVEGTQDGPFGRVGRFGVVDRVDQQRKAKDVGQKNEFL